VNVTAKYRFTAMDDVKPGQVFCSAYQEGAPKLHLRVANGQAITFARGSVPKLRPYTGRRTVIQMDEVLIMPKLDSIRWGAPQIGGIFLREREHWSICVDAGTRWPIGIVLSSGEDFSVEDVDDIIFTEWEISRPIDISAREPLYLFPIQAAQE
jgi:hypothetical protein